MSTLRKLQKMVGMVDGESVTNLTREELQEAFGELIEFLSQANKSNNDKFASATGKLGEDYQRLRAQIVEEVMSHKGSLTQAQQRTLASLDERVAQIEANVQRRLAELRDGESPAVEAIVEAVVPFIPEPLQGSPDTPEEVRDKLEQLEGDDRLDAKAIRGLEDYAEVKKLAKAPRGGGGGVGAIKGITAGSGIAVDNTAIEYPVVSTDITTERYPPIEAPTYVGAVHVDTDAGAIYVSVGTSAVEDWKLINTTAYTLTNAITEQGDNRIYEDGRNKVRE